MPVNSVDFTAVSHLVDKCCKTEEECGSCPRNKCLVGFARIVLEYAVQKGVFRIPQGNNLIPQGDFKLYYQADLTEALAEILCQCQNCQDNHQADCVINVARLALELALLGDNQHYSGSAFAYLIETSRKHPEIGTKLLERYKARKK